jgi:hypothetical protein
VAHDRKLCFLSFIAWVNFTPSICHSDITRVYHPYVDPLESEVEYRVTQSFDDLDYRYRLHTLGYGQAVTDKLFLEGYFNTSESTTASAEVEAFEVEGIYQLTEKGSHYFDYGLLVEAQRENKSNISDFASTLLLEREFGSTSLTANLGFTYEYGAGVDNDIYPLARMQWRYRYKPFLEPAMEIQLDKYDKCVGPSLIGALPITKHQHLKWEAGLLFGLDNKTPDTTLRFLLEYEF